MLRKILLSTAGIAAMTTASFAADLPNRKVAPAPAYVAAPIFTWTGFYVGADIGGGWTNDGVKDVITATNVQNLSRFKLNGSGVVGGLFAGYNWQMSNAFVVGIEGDIEATSISSKASAFTQLPALAIAAGNATATESMPWQGSIRARLGYAAGNALFYVTGGAAFAQFNTKYNTLATNTLGLIAGGTSFSSTQVGWTLGAGIEYAFNANWTLRGEYRYSSFGNFKDNIASAANGFWNATSAKHSVNENAIRIGIAYKFGAPASAVVAKY